MTSTTGKTAAEEETPTIIAKNRSHFGFSYELSGALSFQQATVDYKLSKGVGTIGIDGTTYNVAAGPNKWLKPGFTVTDSSDGKELAVITKTNKLGVRYDICYKGQEEAAVVERLSFGKLQMTVSDSHSGGNVVFKGKGFKNAQATGTPLTTMDKELAVMGYFVALMIWKQAANAPG